MAVTDLPDLNVLPAEALRALILTQHQQLVSTADKLAVTQEQLLSREREIEHLKLLLAKLHRMQFGRKSEKLQRQIEQLELRLEELESSRSQNESKPDATSVPASWPASAAKPARRALPDHLPRETRRQEPKETVCPQCQGELRQLGEDVSEVLEYVPASFRVTRHVRPKLSCTKCDCIVQAGAASRPIERGLAGPGLLAHVLVSKYADHLPLYRQSEIYARQGVELERSTMADWVGGSSRLLEPLVAALGNYVMAAVKLHADDTPVPVLFPGLVCLLAGSQRRTSGTASGEVSRNIAGRCLCRLQSALRRWQDSTSGVLGACAAPLLRSGTSTRFSGSKGGAGANRSVVRHRGKDPWQAARPTPRRAPSTIKALARLSARVVRDHVVETLA